MKIEELRVGNLVKDLKGQIREVKGIDSYNEPTLWLKIPTCSIATGSHSINNVQPIKIDENILLMCGFGCFGDSFYTTELHNRDFIHFTYSANRRNILCFIYDTGVNIDYLHKLQNVFYSLTNKELEIKL